VAVTGTCKPIENDYSCRMAISKPKHFYKFCTAKVAKINLSTLCLRFRSPLLFNDPFDCYFPPKFSNLRRSVTIIEKRRRAILEGKEILPSDSKAAFNLAPLIGLAGSVPPEVIERTRKHHRANMLAVANQFNDELQINWENMVRRFRLLSLCAEIKNPLLWAHYADCHRGVAIEFDASFTSAESLFKTAKPVKYRRRVPRAYSRNDFIEDALGLKSLPDEAQAFLPLLLTKSLEWSCEKEWRVVRVASEEPQGLFTNMPFCPRALSKIYLGCRISNRNRKAIERLATGEFAHVEIHQAHQLQKRFALEFDHIG
jgi:hypothetical protein